MVTSLIIKKLPSRGVLRKRYSKDTQQIHGRIQKSKCNVNKIAKQLDDTDSTAQFPLPYFPIGKNS